MGGGTSVSVSLWDRFRAIFRETGENLAKAGSQIGGVADQLADWIRTRGGPGDGPGSGGPSGSGGGSGSSGPPGSDSPGGDVFGDELDDEA